MTVLDYIMAKYLFGAIVVTFAAVVLGIVVTASQVVGWWKTRQLLRAQQHWTTVREKIDREAKP